MFLAEANLVDFLDYGIVGILFVMWWFERKDKTTEQKRADEAIAVAQRSNELAGEAHQDRRDMIAALERNTKAFTALQEEVKHIRRDEAA